MRQERAIQANIFEVFAQHEIAAHPRSGAQATPFGWLKNASTSPKPAHVRALIDWLRFVRDIGVPPEAAARIHDDRFQQPVREGASRMRMRSAATWRTDDARSS